MCIFAAAKFNRILTQSFKDQLLKRQNKKKMKKGIHPDNYRLVVFKDMSNDNMILTKSCANTKETVVYTDGNEYPVVKLEISNTSHPFFTGKLKLVDTAGRVDKFMSKYKKYAKR